MVKEILSHNAFNEKQGSCLIDSLREKRIANWKAKKASSLPSLAPKTPCGKIARRVTRSFTDGNKFPEWSNTFFCGVSKGRAFSLGMDSGAYIKVEMSSFT